MKTLAAIAIWAILFVLFLAIFGINPKDDEE
jgi:hypothetical protein